MNYSRLEAQDLIRICVETGEADAWEEFIRRFNPLIARVVVRTAASWGESSRSILDDLVQETYLKLCSDNYRLLRTFEPRQPDAIYGFLKVVTANVVRDHFKASYAAKRGSGQDAEDIEGAEVSRTGRDDSPSRESFVEREILIREIDRHLVASLAQADARRSRLIFWLYYRSGLSASAIASIPSVGLTTKGVESVLLRLTRVVRTALAESPILEHEGKRDPKGISRAESF